MPAVSITTLKSKFENGDVPTESDFIDLFDSCFGLGAEAGTGSPEGVKTAQVGALYSRTDGAGGSTLYIKESGTGNTGWTAIAVPQKPSYGGLYYSTPAATTCTVAGTFYLAAGTTTETTSSNCTVSTAGRITYTAADTIRAYVSASISMTSSGTNDEIALAVAKNGTVETGSVIKRYVTGNDVGAAALSWDLQLATNDYVEIFVSDLDTAAKTVTIESCHLIVSKIRG